MKRLCATLLAFALCMGLLAGCTGPEETSVLQPRPGGSAATPVAEVPMGRYVEYDITPEDNNPALCLHINGDGSLDYYTADKGTIFSPYFTQMNLRYHHLPAGSDVWEERDIPWLGALCALIPETEGSSYSLALDVDGDDIYIAADRFRVNEDWTSEAEQTCYLRWDGEALQELSWQPPANEAWGVATPMNLTGLRVEGGAAYLRASGAGAYTALVPTQGEGVLLDWNPHTDTAAFLGGSLYLHTGEEVRVYDGATGSRTATLPLESGKLAAGAGGLYLLGDTGRFLRYSADGGTEEVLMQGINYSFGKPLGNVYNIDVGDDGSICLVRSGDGANRVYRYVYDPDIPTRPENTLTIYSLFPSSTITTAAHAWRAQNPETGLEYTVGFPEGTEYTAEQLEAEYTRLVLELVGGEGPDLLVLDGLPAESMIRQGVLQDLTGLVDTTGLFEGLAACYQTESGLFAVPARFTFDMIGGMTPADVAFPTLESFAAAALAAPREGNGMLVGFYSQRGLFEAFYPAWADTIWQDGGADEGLLAEFLTLTKSMTDYYGMQAESPWGRSSENNTVAGYSVAETQVWVSGAQRTSDLIQNAWRGGMENRTGAIAPVPGPDGKGRARPVCTLGLRAGAGEEGAGFIQLLLGRGVQLTNINEGYAIHRASFETIVAEAERDFSLTMQTDLAALVDGLVPAPVDATVQGIVLETALDFYAGHIGLEDAVRYITTAAGLYLAEQG